MSDNNLIPDSNDSKEHENNGETPQSDKSQDELKTSKEQPVEGKLIPEAEEKSVSHHIITSQKSKESNYQISLVDENLLKVLVTTKRGVKIESSVKEEKTSFEIQNNEIHYYPRLDFSFQEVEVFIAIEDGETVKNDKGLESRPEDLKENTTAEGKSNYQINLINENLLKVKILTASSVRIDTIARDKKISTQTQSNKIYLKHKPGNELQQIEITIGVEQESTEDYLTKTDDGKVRLIPNPEVQDLIQPPDYSPFQKGMEEDELIGYRNPFDSLRELIRKNLTIGLIAAVILHGAVAAFAFFSISKKAKDQAQEEPQRLIVIQDLPDPKIKLEDVEDPNKPKIEPPAVNELDIKEPKREIPPRKIIQPPKVTRHNRENSDEEKQDTTSAFDLTRELDSLRKLVDKSVPKDTSATDTTKSVFDIPDSLRNNFNENDVGLALYYPKSWILQDSRDLNKNNKEFEGVILIDTTNGKGSMQIFIHLDKQNLEYKAEDFKKEFVMTDSNLNAFLMEPFTQAGTTYYKFYIFNKIGTEKLSVTSQVRQQFFDQYKNEIEAVVRSIRIRKQENF